MRLISTCTPCSSAYCRTNRFRHSRVSFWSSTIAILNILPPTFSLRLIAVSLFLLKHTFPWNATENLVWNKAVFRRLSCRSGQARTTQAPFCKAKRQDTIAVMIPCLWLFTAPLRKRKPPWTKNTPEPQTPCVWCMTTFRFLERCFVKQTQFATDLLQTVVFRLASVTCFLYSHWPNFQLLYSPLAKKVSNVLCGLMIVFSVDVWYTEF